MGAWGCGSFDNDDALDWVNELLSSGTRAINSAFRKVQKLARDYIEAPECSAAVAAAEVVAALGGRPAASLPDSVREWLDGKPPADAKILKNAREVLQLIVADSELKELWDESADDRRWHAAIADLQSRLE